MTAHAIIVGIDRYANPAWNLGSAVRDALRFHTWATTVAGVAGPRLLLSPRDGVAPGVAFERADCQTIQDAFDAAGALPTRDGDQLYVYLACHGISGPNLVDGGGPVIVPCDVDDLGRRRRLLYALDDMIDRLARRGPRDQYFFVDACRSFVIQSEVAAPILGSWRPKGGTAPCRQYALYATSAGSAAYGAFTGGVFSDALLDALHVQGPRLGSDDNGNFVLEWSDLADYVISDVRTRIARARSPDQLQEPQAYSRVGGRSVLRTLPPDQLAPRRLSINIQPPPARKTCRVAVARRVPGIRVPPELRAPELPLPVEYDLAPGPYTITVEGDDYLTASESIPLWSLEGHLDITMEAEPGGLESLHIRGDELGAPPLGTLVVDTGGNADLPIHIRDRLGELAATGRNVVAADLDPGTYRVEILAPDGARDVHLAEVRSGQITPLHYTPRPLALGPATQSLLTQHGLGADPSNYREPSELLGKMPDQTLASLLGLAALAQALPDDGSLHKLRGLGILLPAVLPGRSAITIVVAAADFRPTEDWLATLEIGLWSDAGLVPLAPQRLPRFPAAVQAIADVAPGVHAIRIAIRGQSISHHAVCALSDRVSVLVVVPGSIAAQPRAVAPDDSLDAQPTGARTSGALDVQQYILPRAAAPGANREHVGACVRAERAQRRFAANQAEELAPAELMALLYGKWVDPLFGAIGGYALLSRGQIEEWRHANTNMLANFADLPDTHVLAGLSDPAHRDAHFAAATARGIPVVADGVRALAAWHTERGAALPPMLDEAHRGLVAGAAWTRWTSPRPLIAMTEVGLAAVPPGWHDLADIEARLASLRRALNDAAAILERLERGMQLRAADYARPAPLRPILARVLQVGSFDLLSPFGITAADIVGDATATAAAPRVGQRVAALLPDFGIAALGILAPGILLRIDGDDLVHDCAPIFDGYLVDLTTCTVIGVIDPGEPGRARRIRQRSA